MTNLAVRPEPVEACPEATRRGCPYATPKLLQVRRDDEGRLRDGLHLLGRVARGDLPHHEALRRDVEEAEVGHYLGDHSHGGHRQRAPLQQPRRALTRGVLERQEHLLGADRQVHRPADAAALAPRRLPVGEVAVLRHFVRAHDGHVDIARADERKGVGVVGDGRAELQRHVLPSGIHQVDVLLALRGQRPVADDAVLRLKEDVGVAEVVVGAERRHPDAQVDHPTVQKLHREAVAHGLPVQRRLFLCHRCPHCRPRADGNHFTVRPEPSTAFVLRLSKGVSRADSADCP